MGQYIHMPMFEMVNPMWYMYMYAQPVYRPLYPSMPHTHTNNIPTSPHADQPDVELEDLHFYSFTNTNNIEASGNESRSDNLAKYCAACDYTTEDDESKKNHYASPEHLSNRKQYLVYQEAVNKYTKDIDDTRWIIESTTIQHTSTGISHNDKLMQTQIDKIREWKGKYEREKRQIEDKHDWSEGQKFIERSASEVKQLKEYFEKLQTAASISVV